MLQLKAAARDSKIRLLGYLAALLVFAAVYPSNGWATWTGDLVYCDVNKNGLFEPNLGDYPLNGVSVRMQCTDKDGAPCLDETTVTSQTTSKDIGGYGNFFDLCDHLLSYDPQDPNDREGRYLFNPWFGCKTHRKPWSCSVTVDPSTLPPDCNELVTPKLGGPPSDGNTDGDFCDAVDGPFPEGQVLGDLDGAFTCNQRPDLAPGDGIYFPQLVKEHCAVSNDFGFAPGQTTECGNNVIEAGEQCDGTDTGNCLETCEPTCVCSPVCGDGVKNGTEACDGSDTGSCMGACLSDCTCAPECGDGVKNGTEACDGNDDSACQGECQSDCTCPFCGDDVAEGNEECDGTDASSCTMGVCQTDCTCTVCGNDMLEQGEECDGAESLACPGVCRTDCTCPVCGDDFAEGNEECDGTDATACPGLCLPPGNANECMCPTCGDGEVNAPGEICDGADAQLCPGNCTDRCVCPVCGDDMQEGNEECDGTDATACPGMCFPMTSPHACRCPFCGDGEVNRPGEVCDPGEDEICGNMVDDDNDGLIDCADVADCPKGATTCAANCLTEQACGMPTNDPAVIRFHDDDVSLDAFRMHAKFVPQTLVDPPLEGFLVQITNDQGIVFSGFVRGPDLDIIRGGKRFKFKDKAARSGKGFRDGIYYLVIKRKPNAYSFRLKAWGDFSSATSPRMTTHVMIGNDGAAVTTDWRRVRHGWRLGANEFRQAE